VTRTRLTLRTPLAVPLEVSLCADVLGLLSTGAIERLPVFYGREEAHVGDFFGVTGGHADDVRIEGDLSRVKGVGAGMAGGRLVVGGPVGMHAGAEMRGGHLLIEGDAGDWAGAQMQGGRIEILGRAGNALGGAYAGVSHGMRGGVITVVGSAGERLGERMRRGLIGVAGDVGPFACAHMVAGTVVVLGSVERGAGIGMKRGTLIVGGAVDRLLSFRYSCADQPTFLALVWKSLSKQGLEVGRLRGGVFKRYLGDSTELGRGEILQWTNASA
jgi:formylmethanofuran dehydrogenase subunit C